MENEQIKELAYLQDMDEKEVESMVESTENVETETAMTPEEQKEAERLEKEREKKRKKEAYPTKTEINLFYREDRTTGPATLALYGLFVLVVLSAFWKFAIYDKQKQVAALETELASKEDELLMLMVATKDYNAVKSEHTRYTQSYLKKEEKPIDRLIILDMLEDEVYGCCKVGGTTIMDDTIFINYTGLNLEQTSVLVKELESYSWVKEVTVQNASRSLNEDNGTETVSTSMIIETYATMEEVPADD